MLYLYLFGRDKYSVLLVLTMTLIVKSIILAKMSLVSLCFMWYLRVTERKVCYPVEGR